MGRPDLMERTRIKICGLTREEDVREASVLGADAVGFVCYPASPRHVPPARLAQLAAARGPFVTAVLLFVDPGPLQVAECLRQVPDATLQFHGREGDSSCAVHARPYLKAVPMAEGVDLLEFELAHPGAAALLADTPSPAHGGSGAAFDWSRIAPARLRTKPLVLAGGLDAGNVGAAIQAARPWAVDVSSGVESSRGIKSAARMRDFVEAVRAADAARSTARNTARNAARNGE